MTLYRLKKVKFNRDGKKYKIGDVVDLNKKEADAMRWGIEQVGHHEDDDSDTDVTMGRRRRVIPSAESETPSQMAAREKGMEGTDVDLSTDDDDDNGTGHVDDDDADLDLTVLEGNALSAKEYVGTLDDISQLKALRKAEASGKDRTGVINAIDARMEELTT